MTIFLLILIWIIASSAIWRRYVTARPAHPGQSGAATAGNIGVGCMLLLADVAIGAALLWLIWT